jgi:methyl-accepting chemotaxis protein
MVLKRHIEITTKYISEGLDEQMKTLTRLQSSIHDTNKVASRLATGKGKISAKEFEGTSTFMASGMSSFEKQNLSFLAQIAFNTKDNIFSKKRQKDGSSQEGVLSTLFGFGEGKKIKGVSRYKTNVFKPTGATSPTGIMTSLMGMMSIGLVKVVAILVSIASVIIASSRMLQRTLGNIMKFIMMLIRPIGDMIAVLFYPLMMIIRPLALMMNTIIRPFLMEARKSFRLSMQLDKQSGKAKELGDFDLSAKLRDKSSEMFSTGLTTLGMGFGKLFGNMFGEVLKLQGKILIEAIMIPIDVLAKAFDVVTGGAFKFSETLDSVKQRATDFVDSGIDLAVELLNDKADEFLETVSAKNEAVGTLARYTGDFLTKATDLSNKGADVTGILKDVNSLVDTFNTIAADGTKTAFENAKTTVETLGKTIETTIDGLIAKYSTPSTDGNTNDTGGNDTGGDWFTNIITAASEWWGDFIKNINIFSKDVGFVISDWVLSIIEYFTKWSADTLSDFSTWLSDMVTKLEIFTSQSSGVFSNYGDELIKIANRAWSAAQSAEAAAQAASDAAARSREALSSVHDSDGPPMATGGSIDQNGMYYLHRGETVVNPVNSSFANTGGSSGSGDIIINMNNSTFGNFSEWKREMDKYFNAQMRHMR